VIKADQGSGLALLVLSAFICWGSLLLPYGSARDPGPGFLPLWLGIILGAMSLGLILKTVREKQAGKIIGDILAKEVRWDKVALILLALILYGYLMDFCGFLVITLFFIAFLLRFIDPQPWKSVIGWALAGSLGVYIIFEVWLKLRLPKGFWGI